MPSTPKTDFFYSYQMKQPLVSENAAADLTGMYDDAIENPSLFLNRQSTFLWMVEVRGSTL